MQSGSYSYPGTSRIVYGTDFDEALRRELVKPPSVASVIIPTTLAAGEYSAMAGCTDSARNVKEMYMHAQAIPHGSDTPITSVTSAMCQSQRSAF
jgi:alcohol dehydrogenase class IV